MSGQTALFDMSSLTGYNARDVPFNDTGKRIKTMSNDPLEFKRHLLPSGTRLYYQHRPLPFTGCRVLIHAGSRRDPPKKQELMHLLEHLVSSDLRGIPSCTLTQLERWIAEQRFNCMLGMTALDYTAYNGNAANARFGNVLRFLHQMTLQPTFESPLDKEREIVRCEREESASPKERKMMNARGLAIFGDDPLARSHSWAEDAELDQLTIDDARAAHGRWYHPANMSLIIVGGINENTALHAAEELFVPDTRAFVPPDPLPSRAFDLPAKLSYRQKSETKAELAEVTAWWFLPMCNAHALHIAADALEERLTESIREKQRASYGVSVSVESTADHRICNVSVKVQPGYAQRTGLIILEEAKRLADFDELTRFRDKAELNYEFIEPNISSTFDAATASLIAYGNTVTIAESLTKLRTVTAEDVRTVAREHLTPERAYVEIFEK